MAPRKSHPKGIDPANPQKNFVETTFTNKGDTSGFQEYMWGNYHNPCCPPAKKASGFSHGVGQRAGKLRLSGVKGAHRIGKR